MQSARSFKGLLFTRTHTLSVFGKHCWQSSHCIFSPRLRKRKSLGFARDKGDSEVIISARHASEREREKVYFCAFHSCWFNAFITADSVAPHSDFAQEDVNTDAEANCTQLSQVATSPSKNEIGKKKKKKSCFHRFKKNTDWDGRVEAPFTVLIFTEVFTKILRIMRIYTTDLTIRYKPMQ